MRAARQRATSDREPFALAATQPGASPDDPAGNQGTYWDNASGLHWHASDLPLGPGTLEFPRDQANVRFTWLLERNELELGADYQDVGWEALNRPPDRYLGTRLRSQPVPAASRTRSSSGSSFPSSLRSAPTRPTSPVRAGSRRRRRPLDVSFGLRVEDQAHEDDRGEEVLASTDLAPRAAVVYDVGADGRLLIKATAGRYVTHIPQEFLNQEFVSLPNGANAFDEYLWNPDDLALRPLQPPSAPGASRRRSRTSSPTPRTS